MSAKTITDILFEKIRENDPDIQEGDLAFNMFDMIRYMGEQGVVENNFVGEYIRLRARGVFDERENGNIHITQRGVHSIFS